MVKVVLEHRTKSREYGEALVRLIRKVRAVASKQPGFVTGETLVDTEDPCHVIVISTWRTAEDWENWDKSALRAETKPLIQELLVQPFNTTIMSTLVVWHEDLVNVF